MMMMIAWWWWLHDDDDCMMMMMMMMIAWWWWLHDDDDDCMMMMMALASLAGQTVLGTHGMFSYFCVLGMEEEQTIDTDGLLPPACAGTSVRECHPSEGEDEASQHAGEGCTGVDSTAPARKRARLGDASPSSSGTGTRGASFLTSVRFDGSEPALSTTTLRQLRVFLLGALFWRRIDIVIAPLPMPWETNLYCACCVAVAITHQPQPNRQLVSSSWREYSAMPCQLSSKVQHWKGLGCALLW